MQNQKTRLHVEVKCFVDTFLSLWKISNNLAQITTTMKLCNYDIYNTTALMVDTFMSTAEGDLNDCQTSLLLIDFINIHHILSFCLIFFWQEKRFHGCVLVTSPFFDHVLNDNFLEKQTGTSMYLFVSILLVKRIENEINKLWCYIMIHGIWNI